MMLKHSEIYRYARPELMAKKFTELRDKYLQASSELSTLGGAPARSGLTCGLSASGVATYLVNGRATSRLATMPDQRQLTEFVRERHIQSNPGQKH